MSLASRRPLGLLIGGVLATIAIAVAISTIADSDEGPPGAGAQGSFAAARTAVCQAAGSARQGDAIRARAIFLDDAHQPLHELAAAAQQSDRSAAARLLEAKGRVESGLEKASPTLADDLFTLGATTGRAMAAAGGTDPGPCQA